jgi:endo-1,4-beta-xylanase
MHTRREVLKLGAAALTVAAGFYAAYSPWVTFGAGRDRLRQVAAKRGIRYGTCADTELFSASEYAALVASQCSMLAPNLSWERLTPHARDNAAVTWQDADISFALQNNLKLTGYHLLWYRRTPDWFSTLPDQTSAAIAVYEHIDAMAARFSRNSYSWNVVNEALNPKDGRPDGPRIISSSLSRPLRLPRLP